MTTFEKLTSICNMLPVAQVAPHVARATTLTLETDGAKPLLAYLSFVDDAGTHVTLFQDWLLNATLASLRADVEAFNADPAAGWAALADAAHETLAAGADDARRSAEYLEGLAARAASLRAALVR